MDEEQLRDQFEEEVQAIVENINELRLDPRDHIERLEDLRLVCTTVLDMEISAFKECHNELSDI